MPGSNGSYNGPKRPPKRLVPRAKTGTEMYASMLAEAFELVDSLAALNRCGGVLHLGSGNQQAPGKRSLEMLRF